MKKVVEMKNITKVFPGVKANDNINFELFESEVHVLLGENGAGKTTLMNILYGLHRADSGSMFIDGAPTRIKSSADALSLGIGMVHQHFMLIPRFTVLENVMLGSEGGALLKLGRASTIAKLKELGQTFDMEVDPDLLVSDLNVGMRQRVEILKDKLGLELNLVKSSDKNLSTNYWSICKQTKLPLDPFDGIELLEEEFMPWQDKDYISIDGYLEDIETYSKIVSDIDRKEMRKYS
jgi:ABC-type oligopeptide transport system ATPase subunit